MPINFSADVDYYIPSVANLREAFSDWRSPKARPLVKAFEKWEGLYQQYMESHFDSGGSGTWLPLAKSTILRKQKEGLNNGILVRTGILRDSLRAKFKPRRRQGRLVYSFRPVPDFVHISGKSMLLIVFYHQAGTENMPARPIVIPPDTTMRRRMGTIMGKAMAAVMTQS